MPKINKIYIGTDQIHPPKPPRFFFRALAANTVLYFRKTWSPTSITLQYSRDWTTYYNFNVGGGVTLPARSNFYVRNASTTDTGFSTSSSDYYYFEMSGGWNVGCGWEIGYLLNQEGTTTLTGDYCFYRLFYNCAKLISAPILNATTLTSGCYYYMFYGCSLTTTPDLPAITAPSNCYNCMFKNCTSLVTCCSLPATSVATQCYSEMFRGCSNLTTLPTLSATGSIASRAYSSMFNGCSKIKLSQTQEGEYQTAYRIPPTGSASWNVFSGAASSMFSSTGWTWTWSPSANTTYYTSNTLV